MADFIDIPRNDLIHTNTGIDANVPTVPGALSEIGSALSGNGSVGTGEGSQSIWSAFNDWLTGNKQFERQQILLKSQQDFNASEAQKNRDYQTKMSNTAYQRAVEDLKAAGLNPYLAYSQGGSSTPSGSFASSGLGSAPGSGRGFSSIVGLVGGLIGSAFNLAQSSMKRQASVNNLQSARLSSNAYLFDRLKKNYHVVDKVTGEVIR